MSNTSAHVGALASLTGVSQQSHSVSSGANPPDDHWAPSLFAQGAA